MIKIGDFARMSQVSIKTLRHYDAIGVLRPAHVQAETGYRFYDMAQLADLTRILALKDCGFTLDEIAQALSTCGIAEITDMLRQRIAAQQRLIADEQERLQRISARLDQLEGDANGALDVVFKRSQALTLVGLRATVPRQRDIGPFAVSVAERFHAQGLLLTSPLIHLYFAVDPEAEGFDLFVGSSVSAMPLDDAGWQCERLAAGDLLACVIYRGGYERISHAFIALGRWLATGGYQIAGSCREVYHCSPAHTDDSSNYITELQLPVVAVHGESSIPA